MLEPASWEYTCVDCGNKIRYQFLEGTEKIRKLNCDCDSVMANMVPDHSKIPLSTALMG